MRYMCDVFIDGYIRGMFRINRKECIFVLHNPIKKTDFICKGKYKEIKNIPSEYIVGIKGNIEGNMLKVINVEKLKIYGVEE